MTLPSLPADKANHFLYGALVASVLSVLAGWVLGLAACVAIAVAKELMDLTDDDAASLFDPRDALATIGGGVVVLAPLIMQEVV